MKLTWQGRKQSQRIHPSWSNARPYIQRKPAHGSGPQATHTHTHTYSLLCLRPRREGGNKRCFCPSVRPSVCLSVRPPVAYIANNSRTQRPSVLKLGRKVPRLRCDSRTGFKVKRSNIRVTRPINADTSCPYFQNGKSYELETWYIGWRTTACISHGRHDLQGQRSRSRGHVISLSCVGPMAHKSKTNSRSITKIGRRVPRDTCYIAHQFQGQTVKGQGRRHTKCAISSEK